MSDNHHHVAFDPMPQMEVYGYRSICSMESGVFCPTKCPSHWLSPHLFLLKCSSFHGEIPIAKARPWPRAAALVLAYWDSEGLVEAFHNVSLYIQCRQMINL